MAERKRAREWKYVLQSKHTSKESAGCSDGDFKTVMKKEAKKIRELVAATDLSHYLVFTNRTKSAAEDLAFRNDFRKIKGLSAAWLVGKEHLHSLLNEHLDIWERYEEEVVNPVRFNRDDLIKIIHSFSGFIQHDADRAGADSLRHLKLERKNELTNISPEYFSDLQRHSLPIFDKIRSFLENPRNEEHLDRYRDTADDLRGQLRTSACPDSRAYRARTHRAGNAPKDLPKYSANCFTARIYPRVVSGE
jgi:hypothetical protein